MSEQNTGKTKEDKEIFGQLILGWQTNRELEPIYWLKPTAKPGEQVDDDLFRVPAQALGCHTAIVAQSGSGKSFFLGRVVEELLLSTRARCIIFDPNADFRRVSDVVENKFWAEAKYDRVRRDGYLPHERNAAEFASPWQDISKLLQVGPRSYRSSEPQRYALIGHLYHLNFFPAM